MADDQEAASPGLARLVSASELALAAYTARSWPEAIKLWEAILREQPEDTTCQIMIARCSQYLADPPPEPWDGVYHMLVK